MTEKAPAFPLIPEPTGQKVLDLVRGCTFDDFILRPQKSVVARRDPAVIDLSCRLSRRIVLNRPIVSANMDTVTRAPDGDRAGRRRRDRDHRPGLSSRRDRTAGTRSREGQALPARRHRRSLSHSAGGLAGRSGVDDVALARRHARRRRRRRAAAGDPHQPRHPVRPERQHPGRGAHDPARAAGRSRGADHPRRSRAADGEAQDQETAARGRGQAT